MKKNIINTLFSVTILAFVGLIVGSCDQETNTGYSTLNPASPTLTITPGFTSPVALVENDATYEYTVALSVPQMVDVKLYAKQIDGTAGSSDYTMTGSIVIPAGSTTGKGKITILSDTEIEDTETLTIQIGDNRTANAGITPVTIEFSIGNLTKDDLLIGLSWAPSSPTTDDTGTDIDPLDFADMRLLITNSPYTTVLGEADGAEFESYSMLGSMADGEYLIVADFYEAMATPIRNLDLTVSFEQLGVIDPFSMEFSNAISNKATCPLNYYIMASVTKVGNTYTISEVGAGVPEVPWFGDDSGYPSEFKMITSCETTFSGLVFGWMLDFWGEEVVAEEYPKIIIDEDAGTVEIPSQDYITTLYNGDEYPYSIEGSGTIDKSGAFPVMTITYVLDQDGFNPSQYSYEQGWMTDSVFVAKLTLDPEGLKSAKMKLRSTNFVKPKR